LKPLERRLPHFYNPAHMTRLLLIDDDADILQLLTKFLRQHGYETEAAADGLTALALLQEQKFDLILLDLMLPGEDGLSLCRRIRTNERIPIIMLTAISETTDRVVGLELGADDYLTKPFDSRELLARIRAVLRRAGENGNGAASGSPLAYFRFAGFQLDVARRELRSTDGTFIPISSGEFTLLLTFIEHPGRVLSRDQLMDLMRGGDYAAFDRSIDTQVSRLRRKVELDPASPILIKTVRNGGYLFTPKVQRG
jgi:two-component system OmpR family response regulator